MYSLVVGKIPFKDPDSRKLKAQILEMEPQFPSDLNISVELKDLILLMLAKDPEQRATIYNIYHHPWYKGKLFENSKYRSLNMDIAKNGILEQELFEAKEKSSR